MASLINLSVPTAALAAKAVTLAKTDDITRGNIIVGGIANAPTSTSFKTSGAILIGDGTDAKSIVPTGDVTITSAGVTAIGAGKVTAAMLNFTIPTYLEASLTIPTASVLVLNGTPLTIVAAPGSGKYIEVISASVNMTYKSIAYATNTIVQLINTGADIAQIEESYILPATVSKNTKFNSSLSVAAGQTQIITNTALQVKVKTGNPTAGDSDIIVKVLYRIITI